MGIWIFQVGNKLLFCFFKTNLIVITLNSRKTMWIYKALTHLFSIRRVIISYVCKHIIINIDLKQKHLTRLLELVILPTSEHQVTKISALASAVSTITPRANQQWDMVVLLWVVDAKSQGNVIYKWNP